MVDILMFLIKIVLQNEKKTSNCINDCKKESTITQKQIDLSTHNGAVFNIQKKKINAETSTCFNNNECTLFRE